MFNQLKEDNFIIHQKLAKLTEDRNDDRVIIENNKKNIYKTECELTEYKNKNDVRIENSVRLINR